MSSPYFPDKSLYRKLIEAGYPESDMDHHESDLYVYVTSVTTKVIDEHFKTKAKRDTFVKKFRDNLTRRPMYDIAFAYDPWWLDKTKFNEPKEKNHEL